jgi:serine/threonine protein kinase
VRRRRAHERKRHVRLYDLEAPLLPPSPAVVRAQQRLTAALRRATDLEGQRDGRGGAASGSESASAAAVAAAGAEVADARAALAALAVLAAQATADATAVEAREAREANAAAAQAEAVAVAASATAAAAAAAVAAAAAAALATAAAERDVGEAQQRSREPQEYTLAHMVAATGGFDDGCKIDEGSFGAVFRGVLQPPAWPSGRIVAIKVLKPEAAAKAAGVAQKHQQFVAAGSFHKEREVLSKKENHHRNIVWLLGSCLSDDTAARQCLVLEWMGGGSLKDRITATSAAPPLAAQERFGIASDVARGIRHMHVVADPPIIHQDIKSLNILLAEVDGQLVAKIADFGTARYVPELLEGESHHSTDFKIGTRAYMPMEYLQSGHVSEKTDTFAFGVVLCELLTGDGAVSDYATGEMLSAKMYAPMQDPEQLLEPLLDTRLSGGRWPLSRAFSLARVARRCIEMAAAHRCVVDDVLSQLDAVAGREVPRRAGRGEEYDGMTGYLVQNDEKKKQKKTTLKKKATAAASSGRDAGGGASMLGQSDRTS